MTHRNHRNDTRRVSDPAPLRRWLSGLAMAMACLGGLAATLPPEAPSDSVVVFNEVMYHPVSNLPDDEWIEFHNQMSVDVDLSRWTLRGDVDFDFPAGTVLVSGGYLVVARNPSAIRPSARTDAVLGPWSGTLDNKGGRLTLRNQNRRLMDELDYTDAAPWPTACDGSGASLSKTRRLSPGGRAENWRASSQKGGTPGSVNFPILEGTQPPARFLLSRDSVSRIAVAGSASEDPGWVDPGHDDTGWAPATASVGYELSLPAGPVPPAPRAYYPLDGNLEEGTGGGPAAISSGVTFSTNTPPLLRRGRSADFGGSSSFLQINDPVDPGEYTLATWVRMDSIRASGILLRTDGGGPRSSWSHQIRTTSNGRFEHYLFDGGAQLVTGTTLANRTNWYHVAVTARSGGVMRLYVNGVQEGGDRPVGALWGGGDQWRAGSDSGDNRGFLDGRLADLVIWHQELGAADIARLASGVQPSLLAGFRGLFLTDVEPSFAGREGALRLRIPFLSPPGASYSLLQLDVQFADGFTAWINGTEVARVNATGTTNRVDDDVPRTLSLNLSNAIDRVRSGSNILAVQALKSSASDSNFLFTARLSAQENAPPPDPVPVTLSEIPQASATPFWVELRNLGDQPLDLSTLTVRLNSGTPRALPARMIPAGGYMTITEAELGGRPAIGDKVHLLTSSTGDPVDSASVLGILQGRTEAAPRGDWLFPSAPTPGEGNRFEFREEIVINEIMYHQPPRYPAAGVPGAQTNLLLMPFSAVWRYENSGAEPAPDWTLPGYDDSSWPSGAAPLGTVTGAVPLPLKTPVPGNGKTTVYFRTQFEAGAAPPGARLILTPLIDDGAVFYLNGAEVYRLNLTNGPVTPTTRARTNIASYVIGFPAPIPIGPMVPGLNTLAVELHQATTNATADLLLAARLHLAWDLTPGTPGEDYEPDDGEWLELYNRSAGTVDLSGWKLDGGIHYVFPSGTSIPSNGYLVVTRDRLSFHARFPEVPALGDYEGKLSDRADRILLLDRRGNPADEVVYHTERPWPEAADGGGSSLELLDPRADNSIPEAWGASEEGNNSPWRHYSFRASAINPLFTPTVAPFHELRLCLLDSGEALLDNVSVVEDPGLAPVELIQNGGMTNGLARWRKTGTHIRTRSVDSPDAPGNPVMQLVATGPGSYLNNIVETTLKRGNTPSPVLAGRDYQISFDAKWISGSPMLRCELYYNKVAATVRLEMPSRHGTPGRRNSRAVDNLGPTYQSLTHAPAVPRLREGITVSVQAGDPDGLQSVTLAYAPVGRPWTRVPMTPAPSGGFEASIPPQTNAVQIQYFVEGVDTLGATTTHPPGGTNSRAYLKVESAPTVAKVPILRILADPKEALGLMPLTNLLSDAYIDCTFILGEKEVIHGAGVRLHGSMHSRQNQDSVGFNVQFPSDRAYKGLRTGLILRRRDLGEILCRHILANGPDVPGNHDEFLHLISPLPGNTGLARVILGNDDRIWSESQFDGKAAQVYKMEGIREFTTTDTGSAEGYKVAMPIGWIQSFDVQDQGDDKEQYRWHTLISNMRGRDDYAPYIAMSKVWGMTGEALQKAVPAVMDVEEWSRIFSLQALCGVADVYTIENPHNLGYMVRPTDGRMLALQNDWSFYFQLPVGQPLINGQNLSRIFNLPVYRRVFMGTVLDWLNTTYSPAYLARWAQHYGSLTGEDYSGVLDYMRQRIDFARKQLPKAVPFEILNNGGLDFPTNSAAVVLQGRGWIDVRRIVSGTASNEISVAWLDGERWETTLALARGTNLVSLTALDRLGNTVGSDSIQIVATYSDQPQKDNLRISEIHYHPADPTAAERAQGFGDADDFEFLEIQNKGSVPVALKGAQFTVGIRHTFTGSPIAQLEPGARAVVVKNAAAFAARYPGGGPVAGIYAGSLDNSGERIRWVDALGAVIEEIRYGDDGDWPWQADGAGNSLERLSLTSTGDSASNWKASDVPGGTPGKAAVIQPGIEAMIDPSGAVRLRSVVPAAGAWVLEWRDRLDPGPWTQLRSYAAAAEARVELQVDLPSAQVAARFYRLRPVSP